MSCMNFFKLLLRYMNSKVVIQKVERILRNPTTATGKGKYPKRLPCAELKINPDSVRNFSFQILRIPFELMRKMLLDNVSSPHVDPYGKHSHKESS